MEFFNKLNREFRFGKKDIKSVQTSEKIKKEPSLEDFTDLLNKGTDNRSEFSQDETEVEIEKLEQRYSELSTTPEIKAYTAKMFQFMDVQEEIRRLNDQLQDSEKITSKLSVEQIHTIEGRKKILQDSLPAIQTQMNEMVKSTPSMSELLEEMETLEDRIPKLQAQLNAVYDRPESLN